jgi:hypothetical protein
VNTPYLKQVSYKAFLNRKTSHITNNTNMRKSTVVPKRPSANDAKLQASTSPTRDENTNLSTIKEEDLTMPEVQGSSDIHTLHTSLTMEDMEPLSAQQKEFFRSCLDDTRNRLEAEQREERKFYEQSIKDMRA